VLSIFDSVFQVLTPPNTQEESPKPKSKALIADRAAAKKSREFRPLDKIRGQLLEQGIILEDTKTEQGGNENETQFPGRPRWRPQRTGGWVPVTTPIQTATSFFYNDIDDLDRVFGKEMQAKLMAVTATHHTEPRRIGHSLEGGAGALAAVPAWPRSTCHQHRARDRPAVVLAADLLYGATFHMLVKVFEPAGVEAVFVGLHDENAVRAP